MKKILKRLKMATRTSETQVIATTILSIISVCGYVTSTTPFSFGWLWFTILVWPSFAYIVNIIEPMEEEEPSVNKISRWTLGDE